MASSIKDARNSKKSTSVLDARLKAGFDISVEDLKKLMECRGNDGYFTVTNNFESVEGLCKKLNTDPIKGTEASK